MTSHTSEERRGDRRTAEAMLLLTALIWGGTFGATKVLLTGGMEPMGLLTWRFGIAALLFLVVFAHRILPNLNRRSLAVGIVLGVLFYLGFSLQTIGLKFTSSSHSGFITALYVVITPLLQVFFGNRAPTKRVWFSVGVVITGLWLLTGPGHGDAFDGFNADGINVGDTLTLGCALTFAAYIIVLDRYAAGSDSVALTWIQLAVMFVLSMLHRFATEPWTSPSSPTDWALILFLALLASVFTTWCQARFQPRTTPSRAAIIYTMESVFAAIVGITLLQESLGITGYVGATLIVGGLLFVETRVVRSSISQSAIE